MSLRYSIIASVISCLVVVSAVGQTVNIPEPDFIGRPYFLDSIKNILSPMERVDGEVVYKTKALGLGGSEGYLMCTGIKSTVRLIKSTIPNVIIKVRENQDPQDFLFLSMAEIKKENRSFLIVKKAALGDVKKTANNLQLQFRRIRKDLFEVILPAGLMPGEYALIGGADSVNGKFKIPCFGVD